MKTTTISIDLRTAIEAGLTLAVCILTGCAAEAPPAPPAPDTPPNVIIILIDTLRADHMDLYGYERSTTPFLTELAADSAVFARARAQAGCTYPSVNVMLTSRYPFQFYKRKDEGFGIPDDLPSMPELLRRSGYSTAAVSASPIVRATPSEHNPHGGFGRGFDVFDETCLWREAACVNRQANRVVDELSPPFFLYLHYMDPHDHYRPPDDWRHRFTRPYDGHEFVANGEINPIASMLYDDGPEVAIGDRDIEHLRDLYDEEIAYLDSQLRAFFEDLEAGGHLENTIVVVTADHGEEFLEHGHVGHCRGVWDTLTWVPLIVRGPGIEPATFDQAVQHVDLLPTLLDLIGAEAGDTLMRGRSLREALSSGELSDDISYAFADQSRYRAADDGRHQLILDGVDMEFDLFDLDADPLQQTDVWSPDDPTGDRLSAALGSWLRESGQWIRLDEALAAGRETEEMLRTLGYLE